VSFEQYLALAILGFFALYVAVRLASAAFFKSKQQFESRIK